MGDHIEAAAKCVALYRRASMAIDAAEAANTPSSAAIAMQLRHLCQLLERLFELCDTKDIPDSSPFWREFRSAQREFSRLASLSLDCSIPFDR